MGAAAARGEAADVVRRGPGALRAARCGALARAVAEGRRGRVRGAAGRNPRDVV